MSGTMTYVGFDVHARSAHAAAIDVMSGELTADAVRRRGSRRRSRGSRALRPVKACYEAGPTGSGSIGPRSRRGSGSR